MFEPIGLLGLIFLLIAWIPETVRNLRERRVKTRIEFLILYMLGSLLLTIHAIILFDIVFIILNLLATFLSGLNLIFKIAMRLK